MNVIVLAAGKGTRLGSDVNKCSIKMMGKPLITYTLDIVNNLANKQVVHNVAYVVVGDKSNDITFNLRSKYKDLDIVYVKQHGPYVTDALLCTKDYAKADDYMLFLGDEIYYRYNYDVMHSLNYYNVFLGMVKGTRSEVKKTYSINTRLDKVNRITEKPLAPTNNLIGTGNIIFPHDFFSWIDECRYLKINDFPSVINYAIQHGKAKVSYGLVADKYFNVNTMEDYNNAIEFLRKNKNV